MTTITEQDATRIAQIAYDMGLATALQDPDGLMMAIHSNNVDRTRNDLEIITGYGVDHDYGDDEPDQIVIDSEAVIEIADNEPVARLTTWDRVLDSRYPLGHHDIPGTSTHIVTVSNAAGLTSADIEDIHSQIEAQINEFLAATNRNRLKGIILILDENS